MLRKSLIYLISKSVNKGLPLLALPIISNGLSPEEFGIYSMFQIIATIYLSVLGMNMQLNVSKNFFNKTTSKLSLIIGNLFYLLLLSTVIGLILSFVCVFSQNTILSIDTTFFMYFPLLSFLMMSTMITTTILRNQGRAIRFATVEISNGVIQVGLSIYFVFVLNLGWKSLVYASLISNLISFLYCVLLLKANGLVKLKPSRSILRGILNISIPMIPHSLSGVVLAASDRFFIEQYASLSDVGLYSTGYSFGMIVMLLSDAFVKSWNPWFYKSMDSKTFKSKALIVKYTYLYMIGLFIASLLISAFSIYVIKIFMAKDYHGATEYVFWISIGYFAQGVYRIFFPYLVYLSKTKYLALSNFVAAAVNVLLNIILIPQIGVIGAAYSTLLSFCISAALVFFYQYRIIKMPWFEGVKIWES